MLHALAVAPLDEEPSDVDEDSSAAEALDSYRRGESVLSDQLRSELWRAPADPTLEADLKKMDGELRDPWAQ